MIDPIIWVALAAALGSLASGSLGWFDSHEPFDGRKFGGNVIRSLTAGVSIALAQTLGQYTGIALYFFAFLSGAGIDDLLNRTQGALTKKDNTVGQRMDNIEKKFGELLQALTNARAKPPGGTPDV
jgi:hypothetical protein